MKRDIEQDIARAYEALSAKEGVYSRLWAYYDGDQPLAYATERLRRMFEDLRVRFVENWCSVVVDAMLDRIDLRRLVPTGNDAWAEAARRTLEDVWAETDLALEAHAVHLATLVCGEAFLIVWPGGGAQIDAYYNDPRLCHMFYDSERPKVEDFAAKWWIGQDKKRYMTLYYPDRLVYCVSRSSAADASSGKGMVVTGEAPNPYGYVPVFHFRRHLGRRVIRGELDNVIGLQDAINKLLADMMVAAEFGAFRQRYVISSAGVSGLKNAPNEVWDLPAGDGHGQPTTVGEFEQVDLRVFLEAMDNLAAKVAAITRTPKHYLLAQGGDPSGETLMAMESPLVKKVQRFEANVAPVWRQVADFLLTLRGQPEVGVYGRFTPEWVDPRTVQPLHLAMVRRENATAGVPLHTQLRREGWSNAEIAALEADRLADAVEAEKARALRAQRLLLEVQLGLSQDEAVRQLGYDADVERARREIASADAAERLLTAMERRA